MFNLENVHLVKYRTLGCFGVLIFSPLWLRWLYFILASLIFATCRYLNTIICSDACAKHVSFQCVVFVSDEYSRELRIIFCVYEIFLKHLKHIYVYIKTMCKITKLYTQGSRSWADLSVNNFHLFTLYNALIN